LRWLEYGQRLITRHRNIAVGPESSSVGETLLRGVLACGPAATGHVDSDDFLLLDPQAPIVAGASADDIADRWIFSGNRNVVDEVHVGGRRWVASGVHRDREAIAAGYRSALATLLET